jgi:AI-2 transport protein TqsA
MLVESMPEALTRRKPATGSGVRVLISLACVVLIVTGLKMASSLFIPVMMGLFIALLSMPILNWLDRHGLPRPLAVLMTVLIDLLILGGIVFLTSGVVGDFNEKSGDYTERLRRQAEEFSVTMDEQLVRLEQFWRTAGGAGDLVKADDVKSPEASGAERGGGGEEGMLGAFRPTMTFRELFNLYWDSGRVMETLGGFNVVNRFTSLASQTFFALIVMIFVLAESGSYAQKMLEVLRVRGPDLTRFRSITQDIQKYLGIKTAASAATGLLATLTCVIFKIDFPLLWGLLAFLFNYVPAIGSILAGIPPVLLGLILHGFWPALGVMACYLIINVTIGNFLEPMLLGERFGISTVIVILSVLFWGFVWGPVGMLLAVPLTMLVKVMLDNSSDLRWISALMGKNTSDGGDEDEEPEELNPTGLDATDATSAG